jgi:hypothetical protein
MLKVAGVLKVARRFPESQKLQKCQTLPVIPRQGKEHSLKQLLKMYSTFFKHKTTTVLFETMIVLFTSESSISN